MNIAIAGYGIEGASSFAYWSKPGHQITIADERLELADTPDGVATILGPDAFTKLSDFDLIIRSPSVSPKKLPYGDKVWSTTNEFFEKCPAKIIGVTGTKGKGTTSSLISSILVAAGKTVHLVGNIGTPALNELSKIQPDDIVVFELSSFQLWDAKRSPQVAVVLGLEPEHLDVHQDFSDYMSAKANIVRFQTAHDMVIFNKDNEFSRDIASQSGAIEKVPYPDDGIMARYAQYLAIRGRHNLENASAAIAAVGHEVKDQESIQNGLSAFRGLPHRLELIKTINGVSYYDDSFSSAPPAVKVAIASFEQPIILIAGGFDRGLDYAELGNAIVQAGNVKKVLLIGQTSQAIARHLPEGLYELHDTLNTVVTRASAIADEGDVVLLSPGCASFDMFQNFTDRGNQFTEIVGKL